METNQSPVKQDTGMAVFSEAPPPTIIESASDAAASAARAEIEAAYVVAVRRPRNMDDVRVKLLKECERPGFAREAEYSKPVGGNRVAGLSIRAAEAAMRLMGNIRLNTITVFENDQQQKMRISVTDLETNACLSGEITVQKTVERRALREGYEVIGQRKNSTGQQVFIVKATEDDLANKRNANISKEMRNLILRILPADIREEMLSKCRKTRADAAAKDPDAEKKAILDSFAGIGIRPIDIVQYLGHQVETLQPAELAELRTMYQTINDGESTWQVFVDAKAAEKAAKKSGKPTTRVGQPDQTQGKPTPPDAEGTDEPTPQERLLIAFQECGGTEGQLLTVLRQQKLIKQTDGLKALTGQQSSALLKTVVTLYESLAKK